ncbi:MAG: hypothetical protein KZY61_06405 [Clostridiaceae bacterium]|nr:hypothetical protein [Clostridiaceae bacterium]MBW4858585.1 hypothetical protein [Clostridiaceae bacterium]MBW4868279.1 hypothetical protein [Clostridiaceae bacterium]
MDNRLLAFFIFYVLKNTDIKKSNVKNVLLLDLNNLDTEHTTEKVRILKEVGPYFPEELIPILNKSLLITEKIIKTQDTMNFIKNNEPFKEVHLTKVENNKERFNYIVSTLKKEIPEEKINSIGYPFSLILNYDKYKYMFNLFSSIVSNPEKLDNPKKLISLIEPMMEGKDEKEKKKMKEMLQMAEIMMTLEPSNKKEKDSETK